jgi:hypothetical protein
MTPRRVAQKIVDEHIYDDPSGEQLHELCDAIEKALHDQIEARWRPIEEAPKDRMFIWARPKKDGTYGIGLAYWTVSGPWRDAYGADISGATLYAELPTPPDVSAIRAMKGSS